MQDTKNKKLKFERVFEFQYLVDNEKDKEYDSLSEGIGPNGSYATILDENKRGIREILHSLVDEIPDSRLEKMLDIFRSEASAIPKEAPVLWKDRKKNPKTENLKFLDFIRHVYADWIGKGLRRADFQDIDPDLYQNLNVAISRNDGKLPEDLESLLQNSKNEPITAKDLERLGIKKPHDARRIFPNDFREAERYVSAAQRILKM